MNVYKMILQFAKTLTRREKQTGLWIVGLMTLNAILDFFSVASFLPLILFAVSPNFLSQQSFLHDFYFTFGFETTQSFILTAVGLVLCFAIIKSIISLWIVKRKAAYAFTLASDLSTKSLTSYLSMSYEQFAQTDFTRELNRIANLPLAISNNVILPLANILSEGIVCLLLTTCVIVYDVRFAFFMMLIMMPVLILYSSQKKRLRAISDRLREEYPSLLKATLQTIESFLEIRVFRREPYFENRFRKKILDLKRTLLREHIVQNGSSRIVEVAAGLVICLLIVYVTLSRQNHQETIVQLSLYAGVSFRILPSLNRILTALTQLRSNQHLYEEIRPSVKPLAEKLEPKGKLDFNHQIACMSVSFSYSTHAPVLKDVSFSFIKGQKILISGVSGSGKTTLMLLLMGLLRPTSGEICIDGKILDNSIHHSWLEAISYVSQHPYLLDATLAENIAFGIPVTEIDYDKIQTVIDDVQLQTLVSSLPHGIRERIHERGVKLSGGQRQRLAIARALYLNSDVLFLDEITNHLDRQTELEIMELVGLLALEGKTIIMISHSNRIQNYFDRVITLNNGRVEELGIMGSGYSKIVNQ